MSPAVIVARARFIEHYPDLVELLVHAQDIAARAWEDTTRNSYGAGLGHSCVSSRMPPGRLAHLVSITG